MPNVGIYQYYTNVSTSRSRDRLGKECKEHVIKWSLRSVRPYSDCTFVVFQQSDSRHETDVILFLSIQIYQYYTICSLNLGDRSERTNGSGRVGGDDGKPDRLGSQPLRDDLIYYSILHLRLVNHSLWLGDTVYTKC